MVKLSVPLHKFLPLVDGVILTVTYVGVIHFIYSDVGNNFNVYAVAYVICIAVWMINLILFNLYQPLRFKTLSSVALKCVYCSLMSLCVISAILFFTETVHFSRSIVLAMNGCAAMVVLVFKLMLMVVQRKMRRSGFDQKNILVVGTGPRAQQFISTVTQNPQLGLRIVGLMDKDRELVGHTIKQYPVLGTLQDFDIILQQHGIDEVILVVPSSWIPQLQNVFIAACEQNMTIRMAVDVFQKGKSQLKLCTIRDFPLMTIQRVQPKASSFLWQRFADKN